MKTCLSCRWELVLWQILWIISLVFFTGITKVQCAPVQQHALRFDAAKPNKFEFPSTPARFVRVVVQESEGQVCFDELEVYGKDERLNLASARLGGKATASSCLVGFAIHQVSHLNDGQYGNSHSWIAASAGHEWAQIELPSLASVQRVVLSRDREGQYQDRIPGQLEILLSANGTDWTSVVRTGTRLSLPSDGNPDDLLRYAFLREQETWSRVDSATPASRVLAQFENMIERFAAKGIDVTQERSQLTKFRAEQDRDYLQVRLAKRQLFLRDPDLAPLRRILFVARHPYEPSHNYSDILDAQWRPGGGIRVLEIPMRNGRLEPASARAKTLFDAGAGVARDPVATSDAERIYFGYKPSEDGFFHIWSVENTGQMATMRTDGPFHDYYPCPLPDNGIAFISTRCRARFLCWRPQAFVLFRMQADGSEMRPLSHANLSEWAPSVMRDGRILWTRSEYLDKGADFGHTLWAIRPDGTFPELIFGNNTLNCYMNGREVPGTDELCVTLISHGGDLNGPVGLIDRTKGRYNPKAITNITPDIPPQYHMTWARRECFRDPIPVATDYFLVSHAPDSHFGLYVIDRYGNREMLYFDPSISCMSPTPLLPEPRPPVLAATLPTNDNPDQGEILLQDIYQGLGPSVARGSVKYLRVCEEVRANLEQLSNGKYRNDHPAFEDFYASPTHLVRGPNGWPSYVAKASLGLVTVEEDGSARFHVPAGKVLYFEALDANLNEVQRMRSVVQIQPGERRSCVGCHEHRSTAPTVQMARALQQTVQQLEEPSWGATAFSYEQVVQPVFNKLCVRCHDSHDSKKIDLTGTVGSDRVPASYRTLITQGWVHYFDYTWGREHHKAPPLTFGTVQSRLCKILESGHYDVALTRDDLHRIKCWIDLNCPLWPDYQERTLRPLPKEVTAGL